jgi:hypothetical protein
MEQGNIMLAERTLNKEQRCFDDAHTWLAEVLDGNMRTKFEYTFDGQELYAHDGGALGEVFRDAVKHAETGSVPAYELRRRKHELDEYEDMLAMMRGDLPNIMVVVSDFPPELMEAVSDNNGYNVSRKQTMLRVITKTSENTLVMHSQSLDNSDRIGLESIFVALGAEVQPGELLGQRIQTEVDPVNQEFLVDHLMGVYDRILTAQYGGDWYGGRTPADRKNTYDFVIRQQDLVDQFVQVQLRNPSAAERLRYGLAAAVEQRYQARFIPEGFVTIPDPNFNSYSPLQEMFVAGSEAAIAGKTFSGCGASAGPEAGENAEFELGKVGYGDKDKKEDDSLSSRIRCINCKEKVATKEVVKPKSWCCPKCKYEVDICTGKVMRSGNK